jgi:hypothetical protein
VTRGERKRREGKIADDHGGRWGKERPFGGSRGAFGSALDQGGADDLCGGGVREHQLDQLVMLHRQPAGRGAGGAVRGVAVRAARQGERAPAPQQGGQDRVLLRAGVNEDDKLGPGLSEDPLRLQKEVGGEGHRERWDGERRSVITRWRSRRAALPVI